MNQWQSVQQIVEELNLDCNSEDSEAVKKALKQLRSKLHPDNSGGKFLSPSEEEQYYAVLEALNFLTEEKENRLAPVPQTNDSLGIQVLTQVLRQSTESHFYTKESEFRKEIKSSIASQYIPARITSGVFASICGSLMAFSGAIKDNPVFGHLVNNSIIHMGIIAIFIYALIFFVFSWISEQKAARNVEYLMSESGRAHAFEFLIHKVIHFPEQDEFSLPIYLECLESLTGFRSHGPTNVFHILPGRLTHVELEKIGKLHIEALESNGLVTRKQIKSIHPIYIIATDIDEINSY